MFNFKAFFSALLLGVPWIFGGHWKMFFGTFAAMAVMVGVFFFLDPNYEKAAERPIMIVIFFTIPAFLLGFLFAEKRPKNVLLRGITVLVAASVSWFVVGNLVLYGLETGIIPEWKIDYEAPLTGALAGNVDGHKRLPLDSARQCKAEYDDNMAAINQAERDLAALKPRTEDGLNEKIRLDRESKAIGETRSRNLSSSQNDALNRRIRSYNRDVQSYNAENKAYFAERDRLLNINVRGTLPDDWHQRCTVKTSIHYDNYRQVCTLRDFDPFSGGNFFCKQFPIHQRHMEKQIAKQIKAQP